MFSGPSGYLKGLAHRRAGRLPAAAIEWRAALEETQKLLAKNSTDSNQLLWKAVLHGLLGERENAAAGFELHRQFSAAQGASIQDVILRGLVQSMLGSPEDALSQSNARLKGNSLMVRQRISAAVLFDPALDPWRSHPGFAALVERAKAEFAATREKREPK